MNSQIRNKLIVLIMLSLLIFGIFPNTIGASDRPILNIKNEIKSADIFNDFLFDLKIKAQKRIAHFPSLSCCIIKDDEVVWSKTYGFSRLYLRQRATSKTTYRLGSISKSFTATAVLNLHDKGLLDINDDINDYLPFEIRNPNHPDTIITIKMLLAHQSSIYDYCLHDPEGFKTEFKNILPPPDDAGEWLQSVLIPGGALYKPEYWKEWAPGTDVRYSNIAYTMLGYIIKGLTGSFEEYVTNNIFKPLQMNNTGYSFSDIDGSNMATPYYFYGRIFGIQLPFPNYRINCFNSMGGVISCIDDMSHYLIMHMNKGVYKDVRILNESTIEMMHTIQLDVKDEELFDLLYGLGWLFGEHFGQPMEGHLGGVPGFNCAMVMNETSKTGFIFLANQNNIDYGERFMNAFTSIGKLLLEKAEEIG